MSTKAKHLCETKKFTINLSNWKRYAFAPCDERFEISNPYEPIAIFHIWSSLQLNTKSALVVKDLKFKGQVRPFHEKITYQIDIKKFITRPTHMVWGDAVLKVKNKAIYFAKDLQVGLFENLTWDYGKDPAVDPF